MRPVFPLALSWARNPAGPPRRSSVGAWRPVLLAVFVALCGWLVHLVTRHPHPPGALVSAVAGAGVLAATLVWATSTATLVASTYEAFTTLLANDYCPACAYGVGDIRPEADGCTVCPECGAAWRR
jgi:hypothetical protein